eukprot:g5297.t1
MQATRTMLALAAVACSVVGERFTLQLGAHEIAAAAHRCGVGGGGCEPPVLVRRGATKRGGEELLALFGAAGPSHANRLHNKLFELPLLPLLRDAGLVAPGRAVRAFNASIAVNASLCDPALAAVTGGAAAAPSWLSGAPPSRGGAGGIIGVERGLNEVGVCPRARARNAARARARRASTDCDLVLGLSDGATVWAAGRGTDGNDALVPFADAPQRPSRGRFYRRLTPPQPNPVPGTAAFDGTFALGLWYSGEAAAARALLRSGGIAGREDSEDGEDGEDGGGG